MERLKRSSRGCSVDGSGKLKFKGIYITAVVSNSQNLRLIHVCSFGFFAKSQRLIINFRNPRIFEPSTRCT